jgi:hypothetical protein
MSASLTNPSRMRGALLALRADRRGYKVDFSSGSLQGSNYADVVAIDRVGRRVAERPSEHAGRDIHREGQDGGVEGER